MSSLAEEEHKHKRSKEKKHKNKKQHKHKKEKKVDRRMERMKCVLSDSPPLTSATFCPPPEEETEEAQTQRKGAEEEEQEGGVGQQLRGQRRGRRQWSPAGVCSGASPKVSAQFPRKDSLNILECILWTKLYGYFGQNVALTLSINGST